MGIPSLLPSPTDRFCLLHSWQGDMERGAQNHEQENRKATRGERFYDSSKQCTGTDWKEGGMGSSERIWMGLAG